MRNSLARPEELWIRVKAEYMTGLRSNYDIAREYGITDGAIRKKAQREGWVRDDASLLKAKRESLVLEAIAEEQRANDVLEQDVRNRVLGEPNNTRSEPNTPPNKEAVSIATNIEIAAHAQTNIILKQQKGIGRLQGIVYSMFEELHGSTFLPHELKRIAELKALIQDQDVDTPMDAKEIAKSMDALTKLLALGPRAKIAKDLSDVLKTLIGLERQAFGISDNSNGDADKVEDAPQTDNEVARRIAFSLAKAFTTTH